MVSLALIPACARRPPIIQPRPTGVEVRSANLGWHHKKVVTKQAPETLIAVDGTICRVSPERFRDTQAGSVVYCNWQ